jgi:hypothetical protein
MENNRRAHAIVACLVGLATPAACTKGDSKGDATADSGGSCRGDATCTPAEYCEYTPGLCGHGKRPGTCRPKPTGCQAALAPVCGCDGKAYENECSAHAAGVDLAVAGHCLQAFPGWVPCGKRFCDARTEYCEIFLSDVPEPPTDYFCRPLPASCLPAEDGAARTCDCFPPGTRCLSFCGPLTAGAGPASFHLTCQGVAPPPK